MKIILKISLFELENLLGKKSGWILSAAYFLISFAICFSEELRQSYFSMTESVPVTLFNFVLPIAIVIIIVSVLSQIFAEDKETGVNQMAAVCFIGEKGRNAAKLIGSLLFTLIFSLLLEIFSLFLCAVFGFASGNILIKYVEDGLKLDPVWTARQHIIFSVITIFVGGILLTVFILFISHRSKNTLSAVSLSSIFVLLEYLINRFSFPTLIQEYNIWVFFRPYYLFTIETINFSPFINLMLLFIAFLPLCTLAVCGIIRKTL